MAGTYSLKDIRVSITLDKGGANNQFVFQGFATNVSLSKTGGVDFATAQVEIYGLTLPVMGQLTTLAFKPLDRLWNAIEIAAGERGSDLPVIFRGCVTVAYADLNGSSPVLKIEAQVGAYPLLEPASTVSIKGTQDAATFIQSQSAQAGLADADDFRAHRGLGRYHDHGAGDGRREHEREDDQRDVVLRHKHSAGDDQHSPDTHHGERADRREPLREGAHLRLVRALGERGRRRKRDG